MGHTIRLCMTSLLWCFCFVLFCFCFGFYYDYLLGVFFFFALESCLTTPGGGAWRVHCIFILCFPSLTASTQLSTQLKKGAKQLRRTFQYWLSSCCYCCYLTECRGITIIKHREIPNEAQMTTYWWSALLASEPN